MQENYCDLTRLFFLFSAHVQDGRLDFRPMIDTRPIKHNYETMCIVFKLLLAYNNVREYTKCLYTFSLSNHIETVIFVNLLLCDVRVIYSQGNLKVLAHCTKDIRTWHLLARLVKSNCFKEQDGYATLQKQNTIITFLDVLNSRTRTWQIIYNCKHKRDIPWNIKY